MKLLQRTWSVLRFVGAYLVANLQAAMEYRAAFAMQVVSMIGNDSLWLFFWWTYFRQFPLVHGWRSTDIVIIWAISACGFGICMILFGNAPRLAQLIMNGGLDAYLGMPRPVLLHVCISATDPTALGDVLFAVGAFLLLLHRLLKARDIYSETMLCCHLLRQFEWKAMCIVQLKSIFARKNGTAPLFQIIEHIVEQR